MQNPKYKIYPTLLDAYQWYLDSGDTENAFQQMIDKVNRVPFDSEAAAKGTAFNELVDRVAFTGYDPGTPTLFKGFAFPPDIVRYFAKEIQGGISQVLCKGMLETRYGLVELYGYIDELMPFTTIVDIKTTRSYDKGKYLKNWQHIVYPFCLNQSYPAPYLFVYLITDFRRVYIEEYVFDAERDTRKLKAFCEEFIEFIEYHKGLITDKKVFGGEERRMTLAVEQ